MNPLAGGCHYFHGCDRWRQNCLPCPQFTIEQLPLPSATIETKKALWNFDNITVVVLSDHTVQLIENSPLLMRCRIEKIPNPMDVSIFKPQDRNRARARFWCAQRQKCYCVPAVFRQFGEGIGASRTSAQRLGKPKLRRTITLSCVRESLMRPLIYRSKQSMPASFTTSNDSRSFIQRLT